jgi:putative protease
VADYASLEAAIDGGASAVYFGGLSYRGREAWNRGAVERAADLCRTNNVQAYLLLPRIWKDDQHPGAAEWLDAAVKLPAAGVVAGDLGGLKLAIQSGLEMITDISIPVFNDLAIQLLLRQGATRLTLSPELNREQLRNLRFRGVPCLEMVVHGTLPLMVSEYCPVGAVTGAQSAGSGDREPSGREGGDRCPGTCRRMPCFLEDRQGYRFPLQLDEHCRMTLYNARELCLIEHLGDIIQDGYGSLRLDLRSHEAKAVGEITRIYAQAMKSLLAGAWNGSAAKQAWEQLDRLSVTGLTRGHYLRGVLNQESVVRSQ